MSAQGQSGKHPAAAELVPIADRLRYLQGFRIFVAASVVVVALVAGRTFDAEPPIIAVATGGYLCLSLVTSAAWRHSRRGGLALFGLMLMVDGVYLAWASYASGGAGSPIRYLIVLHLITVALLASYRTGLKLALWHSLLLLVVYYGQRDGLLRPLSHNRETLAIGTPFQQLIAFTAICWFVTIVTASFSAVNERELRRRRYDLEALAQMATRIEEAADSSTVAEELLGSVVDAFDFDRGLLIVAPRGEECTIVARHGEVTGDAVAPCPGDGSSLSAAMRSRETQLVSHLDARSDPWLSAALPNAHNLVIVPLSTERRAIGALVAEHGFRRGSRIERRVVGTLERFVAHGAVALRNAWLLEQVQELAATDPLTGVANRLRFQEALEQELSRAARERTDVTLAMLDVDHFKRLNDSLGHQTGDAVLRDIAELLATGCREYDLLSRYGGEEFALILPGTSAVDGLLLSDRLRKLVAESDLTVTLSVGLATFPQDATGSDALVGAADDALYESKRLGRNRVTASRRSLDPELLLGVADEPDRA